MEATITESLLNALPTAESVTQLQENCVPPSDWGSTFWKADVRHEGGDEAAYFIKIMPGRDGHDSLRGEFESATLIDSASPGLCPNPIAWGTFKSLPDVHFCVFTFYQLEEALPDIDFLCEQLSVLHNHSSPNGKFGFHVTTYNGNLAQKNDWNDSWEMFFAAGLKHVLNLREERAGPCTELDQLLPGLFDKVIPRLLRPLETDGHKVTPVLVHGDLGRGNTAAVVDSKGRGVVFDAASFYAHREFRKLAAGAQWVHQRNIEQYMSLPGVKMSFPEEDFWDRNALYCLRFDCQGAALFPKDEDFLKLVIDGTKSLVEKFA